MLTAYSPNIWIRQKSATQLYIEHSSNFSMTLRCEISAITGLCLNERNLAITNQKNIAIYKIPRSDEFKDVKNNKNVTIKHIQTFNVIDCMQIFIYDEMLIVVGYQNVRIYSFGGIVLKEINFNDNEGEFLKRKYEKKINKRFFKDLWNFILMKFVHFQVLQLERR